MTTNAASTWAATLGQLQMTVTPANYETWLRDTVGLRHEDGSFVVGAQTDFATEWLSTRMRPLIAKTLARVLGHAIDVSFEVVRRDEAPPPLMSPELPPVEGTRQAPRPSMTPPPVVNPALTFDAFVVGDENRLAYKAARNTIVEPGMMNPLLLIGPSGLGKTHLLSAIAQEAYEQGLSVIYAPAERFGNDYVRALGGKLEEFRRRYRTVDLLLIDDVQFFEGKEKFQEEFFHTFNDLHAAGKQVVIAGDRMPSQMSGLIEALRSRLQWGLAADIQRPAFETRLAILRMKSAQHAQKLPDSALESIAERCCPTVRELEGYLNRVLAYLPMVGGKATQEMIEKALSPLTPLMSREATPPDADDLVAAVCRRTAVEVGDVRGRSRNRDVTYARHLAMYLLREDAHRPVAEIGRLFTRDHSTVLAGITRITHEQSTRPETSADLVAIREALAASAVSAAASRAG